MTRLSRRLAREEGLALVLALGISIVLGAVGATVVVYASSNYGTASRSKSDQVALSLAEAGLNYAYATLYAATNPADPNAVPQRTVALEGGTATYYGTLSGSTWTLTGIGRARNPTGPGAADVVRTVSGRATIGSTRRAVGNNAVWNYVYADELTGCTGLGNSVIVDVPLFIRGNLCLANQAQVTGYELRVGGNVTILNSATIGTPSDPLFAAHIGGTCTLDNGTPHSPCSAADRVYAQTITTNPTGLTKPPIDLARWYQDAQPGPMYPCTVGSFPGGFDTDGTMNRSRGPVDLTPSFAYDCQVLDGSGFVVGRIAWTPGDPGTLTIAGTIFFDGDIVFSQQVDAVYQGRATIYSSGKITIANQTTICGKAGCPNDWDPNQNLLALVAGSSTDATGFQIGNYSKFQGAIYVVNDFKEGNNTTVWGPVIANQVHLQNSTILYYIPMGTILPGMPATYEETIAITNVPGSWG